MSNNRKVFKISIGQILLVIIIICLLIGVIKFVKGLLNKNTDNKNNVVIADTTNEIDENVAYKELDSDKILFVTDVKNTSTGEYILSGVVYKDYTITSSEFRRALSEGVINICGELYALQASDEEDVYDVIANGTDYAVYKIKPLSSTVYYLESNTEIFNTWRMTNEEYSIKLNGDIVCTDYNGNEYTVKDIFNGMAHMEAEDTTNPDSTRTFKFNYENGRCVSMEDVLTGY